MPSSPMSPGVQQKAVSKEHLYGATKFEGRQVGSGRLRNQSAYVIRQEQPRLPDPAGTGS